jgi:hypothetical protein
MPASIRIKKIPEPTREIVVPDGSPVKVDYYKSFLARAYEGMRRFPQYFAPDEGIDSLELAHLIPSVPETVIAIYVGINDAVCNKGLVSPFLIRHAHNNVFAFDPNVYSGGKNVPSGTIDARVVLNGFEPPNATWNPQWAYVMIADPKRTPQSLWREKGYIDMVGAKFEDFTLLNNAGICFFIDLQAFEHPVNKARPYLTRARYRGERELVNFIVPDKILDETNGLVPVILEPGEKLYVATPNFKPCAHAWSNLTMPGYDNSGLAVVNENSAVPLELITQKPPVDPKYAGLKPALGSADMTTDWFYRGNQVHRKALLQAPIQG